MSATSDIVYRIRPASLSSVDADLYKLSIVLSDMVDNNSWFLVFEDAADALTLQHKDLLHGLICNSHVRCCVPFAAYLGLMRVSGCTPERINFKTSDRHILSHDLLTGMLAEMALSQISFLPAAKGSTFQSPTFFDTLDECLNQWLFNRDEFYRQFCYIHCCEDH